MRSEKAIKNSLYAVLTQLITSVLAFVGRTIFIKTLGYDYLGISGLFSNILTILSFAELGIGVAISYTLYKPLEEKNENKVNIIMTLYAKVYLYIGFIILSVGLSLIPFLNKLINGNPNIPHLKLYYIIMLLSTVSSYFFAYRRTLLTADQKSYVCEKNNMVFDIFAKILEILVLVILKNYIIYLLVSFIKTVASNISISIIAGKRYPYIKKKATEKLDIEEQKSIKKNVIGLICQKLGAIVLNGTDNLVISKFVNIATVGVYSNYYLLTGMVTTLLNNAFYGITASVGSIKASGNKEHLYKTFKRMYFTAFFIFGFIAICLKTMFKDFIVLWIGNEGTLPQTTVFIIIINFYIAGVRLVVTIFKNASGLYWNDRYRPLIECLINLTTSIILVKIIGITGVFVGTLFAGICTTIWMEPYILYKHAFEKSVLPFLKSFILLITYLIGLSFITSYVNSLLFISNLNIFTFIVKCIICSAITISIMFLSFYKTDEFNYTFNILRVQIRKIISKIKVKKNEFN